MPIAERIIKDVAEIKTLRAALAQCAEYQPGRVQVAVAFRQPIRQRAVRIQINKTAASVIKGILTTAEMRTRMQAKIAERIAVLEARYPGVIVE